MFYTIYLAEFAVYNIFFFLLYTQDNTKLEVRHWFGWQTNNALAVRDGIFPSYFHDFKGFLSL